jgi:hypothetical protein
MLSLATGVSRIEFPIGKSQCMCEMRQIAQQVIGDDDVIATAFHSGLVVCTSNIVDGQLPYELTCAVWTGFDGSYAFATNHAFTRIALARDHGDHTKIGIWVRDLYEKPFIQEEVKVMQGLCADNSNALRWRESDGMLEFRGFDDRRRYLIRKKPWFGKPYWTF